MKIPFLGTFRLFDMGLFFIRFEAGDLFQRGTEFTVVYFDAIVKVYGNLL